MSDARGKPWRIYPKGTGREAANWPIEVREAWAREARLAKALQAEKDKVSRLKEQVRLSKPKRVRKPKLPEWRQGSGRAA